MLGNAGERWETVAVIDEAHPAAEVAVGEWGVAPVELAGVLDR